MKTFFLFLMFLLSASNVFAQKNFVQKTDSILYSRYSFLKYDTSYVKRPQQKFILSLQPQVSTLGLSLTANDIDIDLENSLNPKIGINFGFYGINVGYKIKMGNRNNEGGEFNVRYYGRSFGIELDICESANLSGEIEIGDTLKRKIDKSGISLGIVQLSTYYVLNSKKFAYPAALGKSFIQLKSCGSMFLGASYTGAKIVNDSSTIAIDVKCASLGVGYGYNFVTKNKKMLVHISALPMFVFAEKNGFETENVYHKMKYSFPEVSISGRFALTYNFGKRYLLGMDEIRYTTIVGERKSIEAGFSRQLSRIYFGIRF